MKQKREAVVLAIIETIIGSFIAGYVLSFMSFGLLKFILTAVIIVATYFVIDNVYKMLKKYVNRRN